MPRQSWGVNGIKELLWRCKAGRIPHTLAYSSDFADLPIGAASVSGEDDVLKDRAALLAIHPGRTGVWGQPAAT